MNEMLLGEVTESGHSSLSFQHLQKLFERQEIPVELICWPQGKMETLWSESKDLLKKCRGLRLSFENSQILLREWKAQPTQVKHLRCCDVFFVDQGELWPRVLLFESMRELIVESTPGHNSRESGCVVTRDLRGRVFVDVLVNLGHQQIFLVSDDEKFLQHEVEILKSVFLGIEIIGLPMNSLTQQTTRVSIMINTMPLDLNSAALTDLAYFNFMRKGGLVLDCSMIESTSVLSAEAEKAGLKTILPSIISARYDYSFLHRLGLDGLVPFSEFHASRSEFFLGEGEISPKV